MMPAAAAKNGKTTTLEELCKTLDEARAEYDRVSAAWRTAFGSKSSAEEQLRTAERRFTNGGDWDDQRDEVIPVPTTQLAEELRDARERYTAASESYDRSTAADDEASEATETAEQALRKAIGPQVDLYEPPRTSRRAPGDHFLAWARQEIRAANSDEERGYTEGRDEARERATRYGTAGALAIIARRLQKLTVPATDDA